MSKQTHAAARATVAGKHLRVNFLPRRSAPQLPGPLLGGGRAGRMHVCRQCRAGRRGAACDIIQLCSHWAVNYEDFAPELHLNFRGPSRETFQKKGARF